jgi:hypothetical protein
MSYVKPEKVDSPRASWRLGSVLYDAGENGWAAAEGQWDKGGRWEDVVALRWNGNSDSEIGNPQSRGLATWFIVPDELGDVVRAAVEDLKGSRRRAKRA